MRSFTPFLFCVAAIGLPLAAAAETSDVTPSSFFISLQQEVHAKPGDVFDDIAKVDKWWNKEHTWSGNAANLSLSLVPGGCFCERWDANSFQHGQVVGIRKDAMVRLQSSLGPLQELAVDGILTFALTPKGDNTVLKLTYRVNGGPHSGLDKWAGPVEQVLTEQLHRLASYAEKGAAE
jgi:hypothetical protein